jgi:hypothetical protein
MPQNRSVTLPPAVRSAISIALIAHLGLLVVSLSTCVVTWPARDRIVDFAAPYTAAFHLRLDGRPLADAALTTADWEHQFEYRFDNDQPWVPMAPVRASWLDGARPFELYLTTIADASERDDTAVAAMLAKPIVRRLADSGPSEPGQQFQVRVVAIARQVPAALEAAKRREIVTESVVLWQAAVVRDFLGDDRSTGRWSLVHLEEPRLNAIGVQVEPNGEPNSP